MDVGSVVGGPGGDAEGLGSGGPGGRGKAIAPSGTKKIVVKSVTGGPGGRGSAAGGVGGAGGDGIVGAEPAPTGQPGTDAIMVGEKGNDAK